ncbi:MAG: hypothetical protein R3B84_07905 [Zavarzinella sp.]
MPKRPALIIFRQQPMRAQTYHAEKLTKEGWLDDAGWDIDNSVDGNRAPWIESNDQSSRVVLKTEGNAKAAWTEAYARWRKHGTDSGWVKDADELKRWTELAKRYVARHPGISLDTLTPAATPEEINNPDLYEEFLSHRRLQRHVYGRRTTNFDYFLVESQTLSTTDALTAIRLQQEALFASRIELRPDKAIKLYEKAFDEWKKILLISQFAGDGSTQQVGPQIRSFRDLTIYLENIYEASMLYNQLVMERDQFTRKQASQFIFDWLNISSGAASGVSFSSILPIADLAKEVIPVSGQRPLPLPGPLDGFRPSDNEPWIPDPVKLTVKEKMGINR